MSFDLILFVLVDALKEAHAESATILANTGDTCFVNGWEREAERRWLHLGAWRMTWWRRP